MTSREERIEQFSEMFAEIATFGGVKETTTMFPNLIVIDDSPAALSSDYIIIRDPQGYYVPAVTVPGTGFTTGDYVNALQIEGTELIAFQHGSQSGGSLKVSSVYESTLTNIVLDIDATRATLIDPQTDVVVLASRASAGHSVNIWENQDSGGTALSGADERGILFSDGDTDTSILFIGNNAGNIATSGTNLVGLGGNTLSSITTASNIVAIGAGSLAALTIGNSNFAMGSITLGSLVNGNRNVGVGTSVMTLLVSGNNNTGVGHNTLRDIVSTHDNTVLGRFAGRLLTGSRCLFLGKDAGSTLVAVNDTLVIANSNTTTPLIGGLFTGTGAGVTIHSQATDGTPLIIKSIAAQTNTLFEAQDSAANIQISFDASGGAIFNEEGNDADFRVEGLTDNNLFFIDAGNDRVAVGTDSPDDSTFTVLRESAGVDIQIDKYGGAPALIGRRSNGTVGSETQVLSGNQIFGFGVRPWLNDSSIFSASSTGNFAFFANENISSTNEGSRFTLSTTPNGTTSLVENMRAIGTETVFNEGSADINFRVESNGNANMIFVDAGNDRVGIGVGSPSTRLDIDAGAMEFAEMTAPGAGAANSARLYAVDNGAGKTQLVVIFNTGAVQVLATQP